MHSKTVKHNEGLWQELCTARLSEMVKGSPNLAEETRRETDRAVAGVKALFARAMIVDGVLARAR